MHDEPYAAAFIVKTVMEANGLVQGYSYWTFSDIFEENYFPSVPFHGGFGLLNIHGIAKPSYRAFELLHALGTELLPVEGADSTVDAWTVRDDRSVTILLSNYALPRHPIETRMIQLKLSNVPRPSRATIRRIDADHANAKRRWQELGAPEYLSSEVVAELNAASRCLPQSQQFKFQDGRLEFKVTLPPLSVAAVTFLLAAPNRD
jgi:xylan 1,4-beta-xylosidase